MPGAPPFFRKELETYKGYQLIHKFHSDKLPMWTTAKYGGTYKMIFGVAIPQTFRLLDTLNLNRPSIGGMMLLIDSGRCSLVGREGHFDTCNGQRARNDNNVIVPGVFERWELPDPLTYVFHLRKGVMWPQTSPMARADREVTSADMLFFLNTTKTEGITSANYTEVDKFEALDRYTIKMTMKSPVADMLLNIAHTSQAIFPKECYDEKDCLTGAVKSVSPGPFLVSGYEEGQKVEFKRNPEFYLKGLPYYDGLIQYNVIDPIAVVAGFTTGQIDDSFSTAVEEAYNLLERVPGSKMQAIGGHAGVPGVMRAILKGPLADVRVRRALTMTMDIPNSWELSNGGFHLMAPLVPRELFGDDFYYTIEQLGEWYQFNPERAKALLAEAGYPDGFSTKIQAFSFSWYGEGIALNWQANWKKYLNVKADIGRLDFMAWFTLYKEGSWDGYMAQVCCWVPSCWGTSDDVFAQFIPGSPQNSQKINDPKINDFYQRQRRELDPFKRNQILVEFEKYELDQLYVSRTGFCSNFTLFQPWEMNGASHGTMYFVGLNGPSWLGMHDTSKYTDREGR
ncbi:MAG: hypothetical protein EXR48_03085 [Dehalococcoidia bacterium]|nr:hypothetical protein [Dehalococcoidia bacterium]